MAKAGTDRRSAKRRATGRFETVAGHERAKDVAETVAGRSTSQTASDDVPVGVRIILAEASEAGLLTGERSEHVSFRAPPALIEAAKQETGIKSTTELGILALATLARPDPVVAFMRRTRGRLAKYRKLDV